MIAFAVWTAFVAGCLRSLKAGTVNVQPFSSDSAIPVLMANASAWDVFQTFFYGQDRFGAWPFLLLRLAKPLGVVWSWERVHVWMSLWVLAGSIALAYLGRWLQPLGAVVYLSVLLPANPQIRGIMFDLQQVYPWQLTALLLAWLALRHLAESIADRKANRLPAHVLAGILCALAVWMSSASAPMLLVLAAIEIWRSRVLRAPAPRPWWAELGEATAPVLVAVGLEEVLRWRYHVFAAEHYEQSFRTALHVDRGHLAANALAVLHRAFEFQWLILCLVGLLGGGASALFLLRRGQLSRESTSGRWNDRLLLGVAFLVLACSALALIQLPVLIAVDHLRINEHDMRYFTLVQFFASCAGLFTIAALVLCWVRSDGVRRVVSWSAASLVMVALFAALPAARESAADSALRENAQEIAHRKPHIVLVSGYWDAYAMAALAPGKIVGLPVDGEWLRTPWDLAVLRSSREVLVGHQGAASVPNLPPGAPVIEQYGVRLRLLTADWYSKHGMRYSLYEHVGTEQPRSAESPR